MIAMALYESFFRRPDPPVGARGDWPNAYVLIGYVQPPWGYSIALSPDAPRSDYMPHAHVCR